MKLPTVLLTSVIRGSKRGEVHGGIYLCDLETESHECVYDWDDPQIDWQGRGGDRGLRGIVFHNGLIYIAAANELFVFNKKFRIVRSFTNPNLLDCHEITLHKNSIYLSSTGANSLIEFNISTGKFVKGYKFLKGPSGGRFIRQYNPNKEFQKRNGPDHLNNAYFHNGKVYFSGLYTLRLFALDMKTKKLSVARKIPYGTHNVIPYKDGFLMNYTHRDKVLFKNDAHTRIWEVVKYDEGEVTEAEGIARQGFGRGLCTHGDWVIGGSSPTTVTCYHFKSGERKHIKMTNDVHNAIHGLEIWPY